MWEQIRANQTRSAILVIVMAGVLFLMGYLLGEAFVKGGGLYGLFIAFVLWLILTLISYSSGDQIFLTMSGARKIRRSDHPVLFNVVEEMQIASGLPKMPDIYIIDDDAPNAFATGRKPETASVAVTTGLLKILNRDELQGVIAHEIGHVRNRDVLYMMMVGVMLGAIVLLADIGIRGLFWGGVGRRRTSSSSSGGGGQAQAIILVIAIVLMILAPIIAQLIYLALSRRREYLADATSAQLTRYPEGLASALEKLGGTTRKLKSASRATAPMYIVNPLKVTRRGLSDLSSTHPPISERVKILRAMGGAGNAQYDEAYRKVTGRPVGVVPASALEAAQDVPVQTPEHTDDTTDIGRFRQTTDMMWKMNGYAFIPCACGAKLKVPPAYAGRKITCPHCGVSHVVPKVAKPN